MGAFWIRLVFASIQRLGGSQAVEVVVDGVVTVRVWRAVLDLGGVSGCGDRQG